MFPLGNFADPWSAYVWGLYHPPGRGTGPRAISSFRRAEPQPEPWEEPQPVPWRVNPDPVPWAVASLVSAVSLKEAASAMGNKEAGRQAAAIAEGAIAQILDDCGTPPHWPPGPPPWWVFMVASEVTFIANTLQEGSLRTELLHVASQALERGVTRKETGARAA